MTSPGLLLRNLISVTIKTPYNGETTGTENVHEMDTEGRQGFQELDLSYYIETVLGKPY